MRFQINGLEEGQFQHLFDEGRDALVSIGAQLVTADEHPGYPCRVSLQDAEAGETVLLLNFEHLPGLTPFRSSHAIFVRKGATRAQLNDNHIPELLRIRTISVRAFDDNNMMVDADIADGENLEPVIERMLSLDSVSFLHLHNAQRGCYLARVDRD